ncbi:MAG: S8 family peptidase, partial [Candidatus Heimdallarchaeaceae archaeon]
LKSVRGVWLDTYRTFVNTSKTSFIDASGDISSISYYASQFLGTDALLSQGFNGSGVKIAILDTGIDSSHPDLDDLDNNPATNDPKVIAQASFIDYDFDGVNDTGPYGWHFHGTHCAGIATANGNVQGVAPGAYLLNGKVLDYSGVGYDSWIIRGIDWAIANGADIISMSLGTGARVVSQAINAAVDAAWEQGVFVVVAAGNDGPDPVSIGSPGMASRAFTVGAYDSNGGIADFSSVGASITDICDPDILAPGVDILSTASDHSYYVASGTSMATPAVAGAVALLKSAFPTVSNDLIRAALLATATPISKNRFTQGAGLVNVSKAYEYLQNPYPFIFPDFDSEHVLRLSAGEHFSYQLDVFLTDPSDTLSFSVSSNLQQFVSITTLDSATQGWIRAKVTLTMPDTEVDGTIYISNGTKVICQTSLVLRFDSHDYHPNDANSGTDAGETFGGSIAINLGDFVEGTLPIGDGDTFGLELTEDHYYKLTLSKLTGFCRFEIYDANYEPIVYYIFSDFGVYDPYYFKALTSGTYYIHVIRDYFYDDERATLDYGFYVEEVTQDEAEQGISSVAIGDTYNISNVDNDNDGKYDAVVFNFEVNVKKIGAYSIYGTYTLDFGTYKDELPMMMSDIVFGSELGSKSLSFALPSDYISLLSYAHLTKISIIVFDHLHFEAAAKQDFDLNFVIDPSKFAPSSTPLLNATLDYIDADNDSLLDAISLDLTFDFSETGNYTASAFVFQGMSFAAYIKNSVSVENTGTYTISIKIVKEHFQNQLDNFNVRLLSLSWLKHRLPIHLSIPSSKLRLMESPLALTVDEQIVDTDDNGFNDSLQLNISLISSIPFPDFSLRFFYPLTLSKEGYGALFDDSPLILAANETCQIMLFNVSLVELATLNKTAPLFFPLLYITLDSLTFVIKSYVSSYFSLKNFDTLPFLILDDLKLSGEDSSYLYIEMPVYSIGNCSVRIHTHWVSSLNIFKSIWYDTSDYSDFLSGFQTFIIKLPKSEIICNTFIGSITLESITITVDSENGRTFENPKVHFSIMDIDYRDYLSSNSDYVYDIAFIYDDSNSASPNINITYYLHSATTKSVEITADVISRVEHGGNINKTSVEVKPGMNTISFSFKPDDIIRLTSKRAMFYISITNLISNTVYYVRFYVPLDYAALNYVEPVTYLYSYSVEPLDYENDSVVEGVKFTMPLIINTEGCYGFSAEISLIVTINNHIYIFDMLEKAIYSDIKYYSTGKTVIEFLAPITSFLEALQYAKDLGLNLDNVGFYVESLKGIDIAGYFKIDQYMIFPTDTVDLSNYYMPSFMAFNVAMNYDDTTETLEIHAYFKKLESSDSSYDVVMNLTCIIDGELYTIVEPLHVDSATTETTLHYTIDDILKMLKIDRNDVGYISFFAVVKSLKHSTSNVVDYCISQEPIRLIFKIETPTNTMQNGESPANISPTIYIIVFGAIFAVGAIITLLIKRRR